MSEQQSQQRDYTPQPNQILAQLATVQLAQQDYAKAADVRTRMDRQDGH